MNKWKNIQDVLIAKSIEKKTIHVIKRDISLNKIKGTVYYKEKTNYKRGILLVHGFSGNRYGLGVLAERLADYGFFCLSIDLPSHYKNKNEFTMGELSDTITQSILFIKNQGISRVSVIGHSIGAVGAHFFQCWLY